LNHQLVQFPIGTLLGKRNMYVCIKTSIIKLAWMGPGECGVQGGVGDIYCT